MVARDPLPSAELAQSLGNSCRGGPQEKRPQWGQVVAAQDGTKVTISPTAALPAAGGVPAIGKGVVGTFTLNAAEFIQWDPSGEISGSVISSDKPIAFVGGNDYLCLSSKTSSGGGCDSAHQQTLPVSALGFEYTGVPFATRRKDLAAESVLYRLVGWSTA